MIDLKIGVSLPAMGGIHAVSSGGVAAAARHAEEVGLDAVAVADVLTGDGSLALESIVVLATAAAVTERVSLDFGVLSIATRPVAMLAAQIQTLQYLSGNRVRLGLGIGGFPHSAFWQAVGAPTKERGRLLDRALELLPRLIAGEPTTFEDLPGQPVVTLAPGAPVPPLLIGGSDIEPVLRRVVDHGDLWLPSAMTTEEVVSAVARLSELAAERGRPVPGIDLGLHAVLGESADDVADRTKMLDQLGGWFGMTPEKIAQVTITGSPQQVAERFAAYAEAGVAAIGLGVDGRDYLRQLDLIAEARSLLN